MMGPGFGGAAGAYLMIVPALIVLAIIVLVGIGGFALGWWLS